MGRLFTVSLEGKIYTCKQCGTHLALHEDVFSESFKYKDVEAYLFTNVVNVSRGELLDRTNLAGLHTVVIFCVGCGAMIGWNFGFTHENGQKYKEGKSVLERLVVFMLLLIMNDLSCPFTIPMEGPLPGLVTEHELVEVMQMMLEQ